ncbi:MAG: phosphoglycerate dehydrogenase, partial [Thermoguttaceae bacterium]|nr:phosphoglycerate dehydrogenase [Thermoguttaceae bacterium]
AVDLLIDYLKNGVIRQAVNFSSLDPKTLEELRGALDLAYRLGLIAPQATDVPISSCTLRFKGEFSKKNTSLITAAFCSGYLTSVLGEQISIVSASPMMQERGLKVVTETYAEAGDFSAMLEIELGTEKGNTTFAGALFGPELPRLISYKGMRLDSQLEGRLIVTLQHDKPGVIGSVGSITGKHGVNIAQMALGRDLYEADGAAISILAVEGEITQQLLDDIAASDFIDAVYVVDLPERGEYPSWMN